MPTESALRSSMASSRAVSFTALSSPVSVQVRNATVVFEPGVYGGTGEENRVNLTLRCDEAVMQQLREIEGIDDFALVSCAKEHGVRVKMLKDTVRIFDVYGAKTTAPATWRGRVVNAQLIVKGRWKSRAQSGICVEASDIQLLQESEDVQCPF